MEIQEKHKQHRQREQKLIARLRLATTRLEEAQRERIWAIASASREGLSIRQIASATGLSPTRIHQLLKESEEQTIPLCLSQRWELNLPDFEPGSSTTTPQTEALAQDKAQLREEIGECQRAESDRQKSEKFLQTIIDHLPIPLFIKDGKAERFGQLLFVNKACEQILGLVAEKAIGKTGYDLFPQQQAEFYEQKDREAFARGVPEDIPEEPIDSHTLGRRIVHTIKVPLYDENQQPEYLLCIAEDITERKQIEEALIQSEQSLQALLEHSSDIVSILDEQGNLVYNSPAAQRIHGFLPQELLGKNTFEFIHPDDRSRVGETFSLLLENPARELNVQYRYSTKENGYIWMEAVATNQLHNPNIRGIVANSRDISQRKETEAVLKQQKEILQTIFDNIPVMVGFYSSKGEILLINRELERVIGWSKEEYQRVDVLRECYPKPEDYQEVLKHILQANSSWRDFKTKVRDGRLLDTTWAQIRLSDGNSIGIGQDISDRKLAEALLRKNEEKYWQLINNLQVGIIVYAPDTSILLSNTTACDFLELRIEEMLGKTSLDPVWHFWREEGTPMPVEEYPVNRVISTGTPLRNYTLGINRAVNPSCIWVLVNAFPEFDGEGQLQQIVVTLIDITERKRVEAALEESEERLRLAIKSTNQGIYDLNVQTGDVIVSPEYATMLGYDPSQFQETNAKWLERLHPEDRERVSNIYRAYIHGEIPDYQVEFRQRSQKGDWKWILSMGKIVAWDGQGQPLRMLGTHLDISTRQQAEQELQQTRNFLQTVIDHLPVAVFVKDGREEHFGEFSLWNRTSELIFGLTAEQAIGKTVHDYFPQEQADFFYQKDRKAFEQGVPEDIPEEPIDSHSLGKRILHTVKVPIYDENQAPQHLLCFSEDITARKQAKQALAESEERFRQMAENIGEVFWMADRDFTQILYVNPAYERIWGRTRASLYGDPHSFLEAILPEDRDRILATLKEQRGSGWNLQYRLVQPDGSLRWIEERAFPIWDEARQSHRVVGISQDISDRQQAEAALRESEERFRQLAENIHEVFWIVDIFNSDPSQQEILYVSPAYEEIWQQKREYLYRNPTAWLEAIHPDDRELVTTEFLEQLPQGGFDHEYRLVRPDGSLRWIRDRGFSLWGESGKLYRVAGIAEDITERKQAEQQIRELNAALEAQNHNLEEIVAQRTAELKILLNTLPDYVFVVEAQEMRIVFCNQVFAQGIGFNSPTDVEGKTIFECFPPEDAEHFALQNRQVFESGETLHLEETIAMPDGDYYFDTYKVPLQDSQGKIYALLGTSRNLTELVKSQRTLLQRTAQLEATNQELESFSYSVSHDLRAPLRHIYGFVNTLKQRLEEGDALKDPKIVHYLQVIENSSQKMGQLIDGLLNLSRLGRRELVIDSVDLDSVIETASNLVFPSKNTANEFEFQVSNLPIVEGDATLLQQVFVNLLDNAVKFSRGRTPAQIEVGSLEDGTIFVKDNGVGFNMQYADQVFGVFQRLHSKQAFEGTGIGLSIVQRIIHRHGGRIWVESEPERGTTFYLNLNPLPLNSLRERE